MWKNIFLLVLLKSTAIAALECFSCLHINDPGNCNNTVVCNTGEACYQDSVLSGQTRAVSLGCVNSQQCSVASSGPNSLVGRDLTKRQDDRCHECCSTDHCNDILCTRRNPAACIDDETVDCARLNSVFGICKDIQHAKSLCPNFCKLCDVVDGVWKEWTQWSVCSVTCETGSQSRTRTCTAPVHGGLDCNGNRAETKQCQKPLCPVHGGWSKWADWGSCSATCDVGLQRRLRTCTNPTPLRYGDHCFGLNLDDRLCMPGPCSNGGWSDWGSWSSCSVTCGGGLHSRSRTCTNPRPSLTGRYCDGDSSEVVACSKSTCKETTYLATFQDICKREEKKLNKTHCPVVEFSSKDLTQLTVSSGQTLVFSTVTLNEGNGYDKTQGIFTAPIAGTYLFSLQLCVNGYHSMAYEFVVNKTTVKRGSFGDRDWGECYTADTVSVLKSKDYVYVRSSLNTPLFSAETNWNTFSGVLVHT